MPLCDCGGSLLECGYGVVEVEDSEAVFCDGLADGLGDELGVGVGEWFCGEDEVADALLSLGYDLALFGVPGDGVAVLGEWLEVGGVEWRGEVDAGVGGGGVDVGGDDPWGGGEGVGVWELCCVA